VTHDASLALFMHYSQSAVAALDWMARKCENVEHARRMIMDGCIDHVLAIMYRSPTDEVRTC